MTQTTTKTSPGLFSGNALKLIAAVSMVIDHIGVLLLPNLPVLRIIGRLAFPIFAYMISEGCRYTKNRKRYFLTIFLSAVICQVVYFFAEGSTYMCILVTFSLSVLMIYVLQKFKKALAMPHAAGRKIISGLILVLSVAAVYRLNQLLRIDYGFWGCMVPVFASIFQQCGKLDRIPVHTTMLGIGLILLAASMITIQYYSLLALPLLLCYSGRRGKYSMKYFFYIFYPVHLAVLQGLDLLLS